MKRISCALKEAVAMPTDINLSQNRKLTSTQRSDAFDLQQRSRTTLHERNNSCRHSQASDDDLVTAAQCGDQQAFEELCARYSFLVKMKIFRIVQNREDAEDVMQDTLLRAYTHLLSFRRSCAFSTWIISIGVNSALMLLRKRRVRRETQIDAGISGAGAPEVWDPADHSPGPERLYQRQQIALLLKREMQKLRPSLRSVVNLYYGSEGSLEGLAESLDISVEAAKSRLMRGRRTLRSKLVRYGIVNSVI